MNKYLYRKLAWQNIQKNKNTFFSFALACVTMIAMFYMMHGIQIQCSEKAFYGADHMRDILKFGIIIMGIFSILVLFCTNAFLMKQRAKEFGLYNILGMEKKHIAKVLFWEIAYIGAGSILLALFFGMLLSRLMFLILLRMLQLKTDFDFVIYPNSICTTLVLFIILFAAMIIRNIIQVYCLKSIDLMRSSQEGEKEPKAKRFIAILGILFLSIGYYISLTTKNVSEAVSVFFIAVLCVIAGTYLLFLSGSIVLLKLLKKNKNFYYHKTHFISVSGMMYRMKQNAVGLASICILSTGVLVVLSTVISLYMGVNDIFRNRYPQDVLTSYIYDEKEEVTKENHYNFQKIKLALEKRAEKKKVRIENYNEYFNYYTCGKMINNKFVQDVDIMDSNKIRWLQVHLLSDYNTDFGKNITLKKGEILVSNWSKYKISERTLCIGNYSYKIKEEVNIAEGIKEKNKLENWIGNDEEFPVITIIVPSLQDMQNMADILNKNNETKKTNIYYNLCFNLTGNDNQKEAFCKGLRTCINNTGIARVAVVEDIFASRQEILGIYGSLFFIGIFIGGMFLLTTVLIIYYKQISEGYDDRRHFQIMQKVGMSKEETKHVIRNQIFLVFFLPILLAVVHIVFAFDIIRKFLLAMHFSNTPLFINCTIGTVVIFIVVYGIVYSLTARTYYNIVESKS